MSAGATAWYLDTYGLSRVRHPPRDSEGLPLSRPPPACRPFSLGRGQLPLFTISELNGRLFIKSRRRLNQHLARLHHELVNLFLNLWADHDVGPFSSWTDEAWRRAEQPANQWPFSINFAAILAQVRASQIGQSRLVLRFALHRKMRHLHGRCSHRPEAIVTPLFTLEAGYVLTKESDLLLVRCHRGQSRIRLTGI